MMKKFHIKKDDLVKVIAGNEKGNTGVVKSIIKDKDRAIVVGLNIVSIHKKPNASNPNGGIEKKEAGIHISNLVLIDPSRSEATKTGKKLNDDGKMKRYSKKTGEFIK
jgi:large subunit ribosomal protein L24